MNKTRKILVVDDDELFSRLLKIKLEKKGYEVNISLSGQDAIEKINTSPPDLITLDILMPIMDGLQVLQHIKSDDKTKNIPVILISSISDWLDKKMTLDLGVIDIIGKPINFDYLFGRIEEILPLSDKKNRILILSSDVEFIKSLQESVKEKIGDKIELVSSVMVEEGIKVVSEKIINMIILDATTKSNLWIKSVLENLKNNENTQKLPVILIVDFNIWELHEFNVKMITKKNEKDDIVEVIKTTIANSTSLPHSL